ncbi:MAG TPA: hypothetical protein PK360_20300 [bacterium]|nr:hypothetical protein [bacterium]
MMRSPRAIPFPAWAAVLLLGWAAPAFPQEFITPSGTKVTFENSNHSIENLMSDSPTVIATPAEGAAVATAVVEQGTQITRFSARKITFTYQVEDFTLEGDGQIAWDSEVLHGPVKIQFTAAANLMSLFGTKAKPASVNYTLANGTIYKTKAERVDIQFKMDNGKRVPIRIETKGGNDETVIIMPKSQSKPKTSTLPGPKLSSPGKG